MINLQEAIVVQGSAVNAEIIEPKTVTCTCGHVTNVAGSITFDGNKISITASAIGACPSCGKTIDLSA